MKLHRWITTDVIKGRQNQIRNAVDVLGSEYRNVEMPRLC